MATAAWQGVDLRGLAARVGTPFYLYDAQLAAVPASLPFAT